MNYKLIGWQRFAESIEGKRIITTQNSLGIDVISSEEIFTFYGCFVFPKTNRTLNNEGVYSQNEATVTTDYDLQINDIIIYQGKEYQVMEATFFKYNLRNFKLFEKIKNA